MRQRVMGIVLFVLSSVFFLAIGELLMRVYLPNQYYIWPPNFRRTFQPAPGVIHGVSFPTQLTISPQGFRGDPMSDDAQYRLITVGASTTICVYLDDSSAWPYRLQQRLNEELGPKTVWVGNAGRPGHSMPQHVLQVEKLLEQYPRIDAVVLLIGIADVLIDLSGTIDKPPVFVKGPNDALRIAFSVYPDWDTESPWYARNVIGRATRLRNWHPLPLERNGVFAMDDKAEFVTMNRGFRESASKIRQTVPKLLPELATYIRRVNQVVDHAQSAGKRVIFLTQPTLWKEEMTKEELGLIWGGGTNFFAAGPGKEYYSAEVMAQTMKIYNDALRGVCRDRGVECVEMAGALPKTEKVFYDDAHFTDYGSGLVADTFADYLLANEPLSQLKR